MIFHHIFVDKLLLLLLLKSIVVLSITEGEYIK